MALNTYKPSLQQIKQLDLIINLLTALENKAIVVYVVGGYGLDALYGQLTRDHRDLDVHIYNKDRKSFEKVLNDFGFYPTGNLIGEVHKKEYINKDFSDQFTIEYGIVEDGLKLFPQTELNKFFPTKPLGLLKGYKIWTPPLAGFIRLIEIDNSLVLKNNYPKYPHKEWMDTILKSLDEKFSN